VQQMAYQLSHKSTLTKLAQLMDNMASEANGPRPETVSAQKRVDSNLHVNLKSLTAQERQFKCLLRDLEDQFDSIKMKTLMRSD